MPPDPITSALIGALAAILGIGIRDIAFPLWKEQQGKEKEEKDIFKRYALPLAQSATSVLWRLDEIVGGRCHYLHADCPKTDYYTYKSLSTCYRLAVLLGWMRAIHKEIARLPEGKSPLSKDITKAIDEIRHVLADGIKVELTLVGNLIDIWRVHKCLLDAEKRQLGANIEREIDNFLFESGLTQMFMIKGLSDEKQLDVLHRVRDALFKMTGEAISDAVVSETKTRAAEAISIVDAWIYRDWQDAIGDSILVDDTASPRRYKPIGFGEYELISRNENHEKHIWYKRMASLFEGMDIHETKFDVRIDQIQKLFAAVGALLLALSTHAPPDEQEFVSPATQEKSRYALTIQEPGNDLRRNSGP